MIRVTFLHDSYQKRRCGNKMRLYFNSEYAINYYILLYNNILRKQFTRIHLRIRFYIFNLLTNNTGFSLGVSYEY